MGDKSHIPVMLPEVLEALKPAPGEIYVDGTFGAGGYSRAFLEAADCRVLAIDRDPQALPVAEEMGEEFGARFLFRLGIFSDADQIAHVEGLTAVDGFVLDVGVSSMQLDQPERGFSFRADGPLDMRMNPQGDDQSAADIVNYYDQDDLANLIYQYGQERFSRRVARAIVQARQEDPITRTLQLAEIVRGAVPFSKKDKIDPATRTFQALRIAVNRELEELEGALVAAEKMLKPGGRLVVVSFHSLEDGIVKRFLKERSGRAGGPSRHVPLAPDAGAESAPTFTLPTGRAIAATAEEAGINPRARSAKMRVAVRTEAPAWSSDEASEETGNMPARGRR